MMLKALIIDDEQNSSKLITGLLQEYFSSDFKLVCQCFEGPEAIATIDNLQPNIIFIDQQMPFISGKELISKSSYKDFYTVVISGSKVENMHDWIEASFLLKPIDVDEFTFMIKNIIHNLNHPL